ncbi:uncharacterized protein A1O5_01709 [Cladophialophora psammophila CBS 110553]|uniref:Uncharacterized protein n=1 Tax=Cladophialophora psammophila CBS 110553 TaxID=1182543 RepID=W9X497_9EURO|nr:uncharacterized protein A1O5_01709 [Cladophialophora psammophila CBS 110553]EXJ75013.1 hypothetical protein A1O5_01709 [Cladophialophora psammophila CBS 110553]
MATSNPIEANILLNLLAMSRPDAPTLLDAFHNRFYPFIQLFRSFINPADVVHVQIQSMIPRLLGSKGVIPFSERRQGRSHEYCVGPQ